MRSSPRASTRRGERRPGQRATVSVRCSSCLDPRRPRLCSRAYTTGSAGGRRARPRTADRRSGNGIFQLRPRLRSHSVTTPGLPSGRPARRALWPARGVAPRARAKFPQGVTRIVCATLTFGFARLSAIPGCEVIARSPLHERMRGLARCLATGSSPGRARHRARLGLRECR